MVGLATSLDMKVRENAYIKSYFSLSNLAISISIAMKRMASSNVLIVGVQGLGVEIGMY